MTTRKHTQQQTMKSQTAKRKRDSDNHKFHGYSFSQKISINRSLIGGEILARFNNISEKKFLYLESSELNTTRTLIDIGVMVDNLHICESDCDAIKEITQSLSSCDLNDVTLNKCDINALLEKKLSQKYDGMFLDYMVAYDKKQFKKNITHAIKNSNKKNSFVGFTFSSRSRNSLTTPEVEAHIRKTVGLISLKTNIPMGIRYMYGYKKSASSKSMNMMFCMISIGYLCETEYHLHRCVTHSTSKNGETLHHIKWFGYPYCPSEAPMRSDDPRMNTIAHNCKKMRPFKKIKYRKSSK
jgi:hypothetical protein